MFSKFPGNSVFRQNAQRLNAGFVKSFETYGKIRHFSNFLQKMFENFRKFSQKFPALCVFRLNAQNLNAGFVKFV